MHLNFKRISYKNLLSVGNNPVVIDFTAAPTTLLFGKNGNGKSSSIEALHFALYGKPFRKIVKKQLVNNVNKKNLLVELDFEIGSKKYKIQRGIKPNIFNVFCDGKKMDNDASAIDFQKELEFTILKMTRETFRQIVVLGSTSYIPFMRLNNANRNLIVEDLLDIQIFSKMLIVLKQKLSQNRKALTDVEHSIALTNNSINYTTNHIENIKSKNDKIKYNNKQEVDAIKSKIDQYENKRDELNQLFINNALDEDLLKQKIDLRQQIVSTNNTILTKIKDTEKLLSFFENESTCPTCQQDISEDTKSHKSCELGKSKKLLNSRLDKNSGYIDRADKAIKKYELHSDKLKELNSAIKKLNEKIKQEKAILRRIDNVDEIDYSESFVELENLTITLDKFLGRQKEVLKLIEEYQFIQEILNENGIKSSIIKTYLPIINKIIQKYLQILEFDIEFEFDENFNESIKIAGRDNVQYFGLSEGQKLRIDLCLLFTFRDISNLKNSTSSNLIIFDEIGDSSLDHEGFEAFLRIIRADASRGTFIFMISHKNDVQNNDILDRSLEFRKTGTFTELIDEK